VRVFLNQLETVMNAKRIVIGGLTAGLLFNVLGIAAAVVFDIEKAFAGTGWEPAPWSGFLHLGMRFALGLAAIFTYAAVRPRLGPGVNTALVVGGLIWFVGYLMPGVLLTELGVFGFRLFVGLTIWGLAEAMLSTSVGAWLYKEAAADTR
jgi:hypothetical protein